MRVFLSYRRADSRSFTERISDVLVEEFGEDDVFQDVDHIPAGEDFRRVLSQAVAECDCVLVVIGRQWIAVSDEYGRRRIDSPNDFVRIEVESALTLNKLVIPLLVDNASMPSEEDLPQNLKELAFRNAMPIRYNPDFNRDMARLITRLKDVQAAQQRAHDAAVAEQERQRQAEAAAIAEQQRQQQESVERAERERLAEAARVAEQERLERESAERAEQERQQVISAERAKQLRLSEEARREKEDQDARRKRQQALDEHAHQAVEVKTPVIETAQAVLITEFPPAAHSEPIVHEDTQPFNPIAEPNTAVVPALSGLFGMLVQGAAVILTLLVLLPVVWMVWASFSVFEGGGWQVAAENAFLGSSLLVTLIIGLISALIALGIGTVTAYGWFNLAEGRLRTRLSVFFALPRLIPPSSLIIPLIVLVRPLGLYGTPFPVIILYVSFSLPFVIWIMSEHFKRAALNGGSMPEPDSASLSDLRQRLQTGRGALVGAFALALLVAWQDFVVNLTFINTPSLRNLSTLAYLYTMESATKPSGLAALLVIAAVPSFIAWYFLRRYLFRR